MSPRRTGATRPGSEGRYDSASLSVKNLGARRRAFALLAGALLTILGLLGSFGCRRGDAPATDAGPSDDAQTAMWKDELFTSAIDSLNRLDQFYSGDMLGEILRRIPPPEAQGPVGVPSRRADNPLMASWPEPEMLAQIVERLNHWLQSQPEDSTWRPDAMIESLPEPLRKLPMIEDLAAMEFSHYDGFALREAVWMRDVSNWARGDRLDDLSRAEHLFDWVVRNIQLTADDDDVPQAPWETLWFGRGTAWERAWVFILLLRQQGIEAAVLAVPRREAADDVPDGEAGGDPGGGTGDRDHSLGADETTPGERADEGLHPWAVGVLSDGELHLFEPALGLPIPAPDGVTADARGRLTIRPATLRQAAGVEAVLARLDLDDAHPYPVRAADLEQVVALVEASPAYLALRMGRLESRLAGPQRIVLSAAPSRKAERLAAVPGVARVQLWMLPYETLHRRMNLPYREVQYRLFEMMPFHAPPTGPPLWAGRMLYLKGNLSGSEGATRAFQDARPSIEELTQIERRMFDEFLRSALPPDESASEAEREAARERLAPAAAQATEVQAAFLYRAKQNATYWLGLIGYELGNYRSATDYLATRVLETFPGGPWTDGAIYNLARSHEAAGETQRAVLLYGATPPSPGQHGNRLRGRWLAEATGERDRSPEAAAEVPDEDLPETPEPPVSEMPAPEAPVVPEAPVPDMPAPDPPQAESEASR